MMFGTKITEELIDVLDRPGPGHLVGVADEPPDQPSSPINRGEGQVAGQLLGRHPVSMSCRTWSARCR